MALSFVVLEYTHLMGRIVLTLKQNFDNCYTIGHKVLPPSLC